MTNKRLVLMIAGCAILALLVWYDNQGGEESGPQRTPAVATGGGAARAPASEDEQIERELAKGSPAAGSPVNPAKPAPARDSLNPLAKLIKREELKGVVEKPLFAPARKRPPPVVTHAPAPAARTAAPAAQPPMFDVLGIVTDQGDHSVALLKNRADGTQFSVEAGDNVSGWEVKEIGRNQVKMRWTADGREVSLEVFSKDQQNAAKAQGQQGSQRPRPRR